MNSILKNDILPLGFMLVCCMLSFLFGMALGIVIGNNKVKL